MFVSWWWTKRSLFASTLPPNPQAWGACGQPVDRRPQARGEPVDESAWLFRLGGRLGAARPARRRGPPRRRRALRRARQQARARLRTRSRPAREARRPPRRRAPAPPARRAPPRAAVPRPPERRRASGCAVTSANSSNGTVYRPIRLIVSISSLRRSTRSFSCSHSRSATFVAVTEPNSEPVGPAVTSKRSSSASSREASARASSTVWASWRARCASRFSSSLTSAGVATSASPRGSRKLRA